MLFAHPTKNGTGIAIYGHKDELSILHSTIHFISDVLDESHPIQFAHHQLLMNLAYEVRKAGDGLRLTQSMPLDDNEGISYVLGFQIAWTDILVFTNILRKYVGYRESNKLQQAILYNLEYCLEKAMTDYDPIGSVQLKEYIGERINMHSEFDFILYQALHIRFVTERPGKIRFRKITKLIDGFYFEWNKDYKETIANVKRSAKENNCDWKDLSFSEFPDIVW
ncbi:hypothetical protein KJS94_14525 [Flavihumibacter rivuli]|uniref:DUF6904 family protein n=1 Tax=Flavihumibacter rivuli TaxID=2838156 RepID=UPI001BDEC106|nr:hypothetical protein [Flavihumibacter rivuli]ULQ55862.1 hypothetical protein KJS94_14525 [Flavihumibacter rivuli]